MKFAQILCLLVISSALTACSGGGESMFGAGSGSAAAPEASAVPAQPQAAPSSSTLMSSLIASPGKQAPQTIASSDPSVSNIICPQVQIRSGTETLRSFEIGSAGVASDLKWQATMFNTARECSILGAEVGFKVGIAGRVLLGPRGTPGNYSVPVRVAVARDSGEVLFSRVNTVSVTVLPGEASGQFNHVVEDILFPRDSTDTLANVAIYVGFDPNVPQDKPQRPKSIPEKPKLRR